MLNLTLLEVKKPSVKISEKSNPAFQIRRYGWSNISYYFHPTNQTVANLAKGLASVGKDSLFLECFSFQ